MCVCFVCRSELSALCEETNAICIIDVIVIFVAEHECAHFRSFYMHYESSLQHNQLDAVKVQYSTKFCAVSSTEQFPRY
jgi:hypothetical protein